MDRPTSQLLRIPPEILACITRYLVPAHILSLMMCGNRALSWQLGPNGGVDELHLDFEPWQDFTWLPVVLGFAKLRSFTCYLKYNYVEYLVNDVHLEWLSRGLKELALEFPNLFEQLLVPQIAYESMTATELAPIARYYNLNRQFPLLESLTLNGKGFVFKTLFDQLPTNLTLLSVRGHLRDVDERVVDKLPRTLWSLRLENTHMKPAGQQEKSVPVQFPPRLEECDLVVEWATLVLSSLPPSLRKLSYYVARSDKAPEEWKTLPQGLTSLSSQTADITPEYLGWLPPNITALELPGHRITEENVRALPVKLSTTLLNISRLPTSCVQLLPRSLRSVEDGGNKARTAEFFGLLPPALTTLRMSSDIPSSSVSNLPRDLLHLTCPALHLDLASASDMLLPNNLQTIRILSGIWSDEGCKALSRLPHLHTLEFPYASIAEGAHVHFCSSKIQTMNITMASGDLEKAEMPFPTTLTSLNINRAPQKWLHNLSHLKELRVLVLSMNTTAVEPTEQFFDALPKTLQVVHCPIQPGLSVEAVRKMPTDLYSLDLSSLNGTTNLKNEDVAEFPKYLRRIVLPHSPGIDDGCRTNFPPFLSSFNHGSHSVLRRAPKSD